MKSVQFSPLQTTLAQEKTGGMVDLSTAVLYDYSANSSSSSSSSSSSVSTENQNDNVIVYKQSSAILGLFQFMGFPFTILGPLLLFIPAFFRDFCYGIFARNRGAIWKGVKRVTGMGDVQLSNYRDRVIGVKETDPLDDWGLGEMKTDSDEKKES